MQIVRESPQPNGLTGSEFPVASGIIPDQDFAERRLKSFDVTTEVCSVLEVKFVLATLFGRTAGDEASLLCVPQNRATKLFIHQDTRFVLGNTRFDGRFESVIDDLFRGGDLRNLIARKCSFPAEHFSLERTTMVER